MNNRTSFPLFFCTDFHLCLFVVCFCYTILRIVLLNKLIEVLNALNQLVSGHILPDTLILDLTNLTLPAFFVDGVPSLQLSVFALIRTVNIFGS
jgi:hypothetical protein